MQLGWKINGINNILKSVVCLKQVLPEFKLAGAVNTRSMMITSANKSNAPMN